MAKAFFAGIGLICISGCTTLEDRGCDLAPPTVNANRIDLKEVWVQEVHPFEATFPWPFAPGEKIMASTNCGCLIASALEVNGKLVVKGEYTTNIVGPSSRRIILANGSKEFEIGIYAEAKPMFLVKNADIDLGDISMGQPWTTAIQIEKRNMKSDWPKRPAGPYLVQSQSVSENVEIWNISGFAPTKGGPFSNLIDVKGLEPIRIGGYVKSVLNPRPRKLDLVTGSGLGMIGTLRGDTPIAAAVLNDSRIRPVVVGNEVSFRLTTKPKAESYGMGTLTLVGKDRSVTEVPVSWKIELIE